MNYWCEDLHLRCFWESSKPHCSLSFVLLHQINILTICGCWPLQNLERKVISLTDWSIFPPKYKPSPLSPYVCPYICPWRINGILRYLKIYSPSFNHTDRNNGILKVGLLTLNIIQLTFTCSKSTIKALENGVNYVQSYQ